MAIYVYCDLNNNWSIKCKHGYCCFISLRLNHVGIV